MVALLRSRIGPAGYLKKIETEGYQHSEKEGDDKTGNCQMVLFNKLFHGYKKDNCCATE